MADTASNEVELTVNGMARALSVNGGTTLLTALREDLALTGAKRGCNQGVCGACTVMIDGVPMRSCLTLAAGLDGADVTTVEGLATDRNLSGVQQSLVESGAVQCGFCTSGIVITAQAFLKDNPAPTVDQVREALSGNICRCSGYRRIVDAVVDAAMGETP